MKTQSHNFTAHVPRIGLNRSEVALAIGVSPNTVDVMVSEGMLPPPKKWHSRKVWLISEIIAAMAEWPTEAHGVIGIGADDGEDWQAA
ncbi:helix-turn-helix transcriptional regulator [Paenochrobactrum sp. BZR 588]|uniref:helix-turn-helix transcriptional regulator n=1 Tax=unclassified Paenochrobactrum TaxID=2639760 RepID=UPI0038527198